VHSRVVGRKRGEVRREGRGTQNEGGRSTGTIPDFKKKKKATRQILPKSGEKSRSRDKRGTPGGRDGKKFKKGTPFALRIVARSKNGGTPVNPEGERRGEGQESGGFTGGRS